MTFSLAAVPYRNFGKNDAIWFPEIPIKKLVAPSANFTLISLTSPFTSKAGESVGALKTGREKRKRPFDLLMPLIDVKGRSGGTVLSAISCPNGLKRFVEPRCAWVPSARLCSCAWSLSRPLLVDRGQAWPPRSMA